MTPGCPFRPLGKERGGQTTGQSFQIGALTTHPLPPPVCVANRPAAPDPAGSDGKTIRQGAVADPLGRYRPSPRPFPVRLAAVDYGEHEIVRTVPSSKDYMRLRSRFWKLPEAFRGERVATRPMSRDGCYGVSFASHQIAAIEHLMKKREMKRQLSP